MKKILLSLSALLLLGAPAWAAKIVEREMKCPVCGTDFYALLDVPDPDYEMRLDLKPLGAIPGPWKMPDCPKCGFVIYAAKLEKAELARCKAAVASEAYKAAAGRSTYYRAAVLYGLQGKPDFLLANTYLKASWQEEKDPVLLKEDLELSLKHFTACAAACRAEEQENSKLLVGELLRRLGRFGEARAHFSLLKSQEGFRNNFFGDIADFQLKLCDKQDAGVHEMLEVKVAKLPPFARLRWHAKKAALDLWDRVRRR